MQTCRTYLRSFFTHFDITTVTALPYNFAFFSEYRCNFYIFYESKVSFFMPFFCNRDIAIHSSDHWETFLFCNICKMRIIQRPFFMFACRCSLQILKSITDNTGRIACSDFNHTSFKELKHTFCMLFFLIGSLCKDSCNLFVTFFFSYTCKISVTHSCL